MLIAFTKDKVLVDNIVMDGDLVPVVTDEVVNVNILSNQNWKQNTCNIVTKASIILVSVKRLKYSKVATLTLLCAFPSRTSVRPV